MQPRSILLLSLALALGCAKKSPPPEVVAEATRTATTAVAQPPPPAPAPGPAGPVWSSAASVTVSCEEAITGIGALRTGLQQVASRSREAVLLPYNELLARFDVSVQLTHLIANTHPEEGVRQAAEACEQKLQALANEINLDRRVFEAVSGVDRAGLDGEALRFVEKELRNFRRAGVDKDEPTRDRLKALHEEMVKVGQDFQRNIRDNVRQIEVDPKELDGLPADFLAAHKPNAAGKVVLTTNYPDFFPTQTYVRSEAVRRALLVEFLNRGYPKNEESLKRLLQLRAEYARLLGHPTWAAYQAEDKMAKSAPTIEKFIGDVAKIARPRMERDLKELLARKRKDVKGAKAIEYWDRFYYVDRVKAEKYGVDAQVIRQYFDFQNVMRGLLELYGELFGLRFERVEAPVWHASVLAYEMYQGSEKLGRFYLDLHPRPGKYGHAAMFPLVTGLAGGRLPEAALVCNFPDPSTSAGPALMEHNEVVTFFHEFGHLIHHLLARGSPWVNQSGITTEWDFVEAPSQLLEEWAWDPVVLARFALHAETRAPISAELVAKMKAASEMGKGVHVMRQVYYTALSFELHTVSPEKLAPLELQKGVQKKYSPYPFVAGTNEYAGFGHLEGYSSMYYTYQWSLVLAKDIFTRFASKGLMDKATFAEYREKVLAPGGKKDAGVLVQDFLGRPWNLDAYRAWLERN